MARYEKETPFGRAYIGSSSGELPSGTSRSNFWAGLGDYRIDGGMWDFPDRNPMYNLGVSVPGGTPLPNYYGEFNTPLGLLYGGTDKGNPNINIGFEPNEKTTAYIQALAKALGL